MDKWLEQILTTFNIIQNQANIIQSQAMVWLSENIFSGPVVEWSVTTATSFVLIGVAEIGDKSQIVCMTLAARHRGLPVVLGATVAFAALNLAAVLFGATLATWVPEQVIAIAVAVLFAVFGIQSLRMQEEEDEDIIQKSGHGIFITALLMILVAEFGDKTQIAVAGLSSTAIPAAVWVGATLALAVTSALGVWAGRTLLQRIPLSLLHRISGMVFLLLAMIAGAHAIDLL